MCNTLIYRGVIEKGETEESLQIDLEAQIINHLGFSPRWGSGWHQSQKRFGLHCKALMVSSCWCDSFSKVSLDKLKFKCTCILNTATGITTAVFSSMKGGGDLGGNQLLITQTFLPRRTAISFAQTLALKKEDNLQVLNLFSPAAFATSCNIWKILLFI